MQGVSPIGNVHWKYSFFCPFPTQTWITPIKWKRLSWHTTDMYWKNNIMIIMKKKKNSLYIIIPPQEGTLSLFHQGSTLNQKFPRLVFVVEKWTKNMNHFHVEKSLHETVCTLLYLSNDAYFVKISSDSELQKWQIKTILLQWEEGHYLPYCNGGVLCTLIKMMSYLIVLPFVGALRVSSTVISAIQLVRLEVLDW